MNQAFVQANPASESQTSSVPRETFLQFIWRNKINRRYLLIAAMGTIVQFVIFKMLYPFPDFFSDSYSYLYAAYKNMDVSIWPIGYSKFLRWFHFITSSDTALVGFQYFFLEFSTLYFFFSVIRFFNLGKSTKNILFIFFFINPLFLYLANYVNSDPLFAALSILWLTQLLWIIHSPKLSYLFIHSILLFLCFTVRNNAYYYPIISAFAFILSRQRISLKLLGVVLPMSLIVPFILHTRNAAYKLTGTKQFSLFTGWQLANNALYIYQDLDIDPNDLPSTNSRELDTLTKKFYRRIVPEFRELLSDYVGNFFIRQPESPLKIYMSSHYHVTNEMTSIVAWGKASSVFDEYGTYLIKSDPAAYIREFVLLNTKNYFYPPLEKLEIYNLGMDEVWLVAKVWFQYKDEKVTAFSKTIQGKLLYLFPAFFLTINIIFLVSLVWIFIQKGFKLSSKNSRILYLILSFWFLNFVFSIAATVNVLRYQFFPMLVIGAFVIYIFQTIEAPSIKKNIAVKYTH